ncbi:MAG TPA: cysteine--tRNA ligase [Devosia sp.]|nr:cysteine--tRNA ligase [Devosia sp.]
MASDLTLRLYNTLTRTKEDFVPLDANNVRMYVCGPTVYDFAHIGNARPAIVFDVLFRLLRHIYGEAHVTYVRNITDVDDKINARAARDFPDLPLNEAIRRVTETTAAQYQKDVTALGCLQPTVQPRATENIAEMQALIGKLLANAHAYEAAEVGEVLFDVQSMPEYGALSGRDLEHNLAGARVEVDAHKRNPADFVLWKRSSASEPGWDSPWGRGRPGWHLECSAMSERYLGEVFDIHAGGLDLIFPHHENEIAQSRCAHGTATMARTWLHNGFLQVEGQKMSKSLGNFITIRELLETEKFGGRAWPGEVLRLAMLMTHYREPIDFTVKRLEEAEEKLRGWQRVASSAPGDGAVDTAVLEALGDDLGFHRASVAMDAIARTANRGTDRAAASLAATLRFFGFTTDGLLRSADVFDHSRIDDAVAARLAALEARDFAKADEIRAALLGEGIQLMDSKNDAGERVTRWEIKR